MTPAEWTQLANDVEVGGAIPVWFQVLPLGDEVVVTGSTRVPDVRGGGLITTDIVRRFPAHLPREAGLVELFNIAKDFYVHELREQFRDGETSRPFYPAEDHR